MCVSISGRRCVRFWHLEHKLIGLTWFLFQFVELKGAVFKKFDKNNLFQVSCSDVRERFHLFALLFVVVVQTMKEYGWKEGKCFIFYIFVLGQCCNRNCFSF